MGGRICRIESAFIARRRQAPDLAGALATAIGHVQGVGALRRAGEAIAAEMDTWCRGHQELAYHNRHHAAEAALTMGWLCAYAVDWNLLSPLQAAAGVVAMLGHDMLHDGSAGRDGALEARSSAAATALASSAGVDGPALAIVADVILATYPALVGDNAARTAGRLPPGPLGRSHDLLRTLANEADICASLLPRLGPSLGEALACEWRPLNDPGLLAAGTHAGRLLFLRSFPALSRPAARLGLEDARAACLAAYAAAGAATGGDATAEAGCAALDRASPDAQTAYDAAVLASAQAARRRDQGYRAATAT